MEYRKIKRMIMAGPDRGKTRCFYTFRTRRQIDKKQAMAKMRQHTGMSRGDIVRVLHLVSDLIRDELKAGNTVHIDQIGFFRPSPKSGEVEENATFHPNRIEGIKIIFIPDEALKLQPHEIKFSPGR